MAGAQFEIQLGHLCNNRCVFCVSGKLTHEGEAPLLDVEVLLERLRAARRAGHARVTLLGGEPTIQPAFLPVVREAVALGFEEIVVFSNGSKPGRTDLIDEVLATGGRFEWRLSFQGATREAHERTTRRKGSFAQLERTLERLHARGQKITVNMCVVESNFASLPEFAALLLPFGVRQLHVDMLNPYDTGTMTDDEVRAIQPRYAELAAPLTRMVEAFPAGFDVNVGNLPYCIAPHLAPYVHHGGQPTATVTADDFGERGLQPERNKYLHKGSGKLKPATCRACAFDHRCDGVFEPYARWFGTDELVAVTEPPRALLALHLRPLLRVALAELPAPFRSCALDEHDLRRVTLHLRGDGARLSLALSEGTGGAAATERFRCDVVAYEGEVGALLSGLRALFDRFEAAGAPVVHAPAADAFAAPRPTVAAQLARLRAAAPFGALRWTATHVEADRAELTLRSPDEERVIVWLGERAGRATGGYRLADDVTTPSAALRSGLEAAFSALRR